MLSNMHLNVFTNMHLTVLTNNVPMINLLSAAPHIKLVSAGGIYSATEKAFYGNLAIQTLENYFVDKVFFSAALFLSRMASRTQPSSGHLSVARP